MKTRATPELLANPTLQALVAIARSELMQAAANADAERIAGILWDVLEAGASVGRLQYAEAVRKQITEFEAEQRGPSRLTDE